MGLNSCGKDSPIGPDEPEMPGNTGDDNDADNDDNPTTPSLITVNTMAADPGAYDAMLTGNVSGYRIPDEVGFECSYSGNFEESQTVILSETNAGGNFRLKLEGVVDLAKIYYRAYALFDGEKFYGKTKSFETKQGTYVQDGKTYKFIKVTGLPTGSFSMMQTELLTDTEFIVDGHSYGIADADGNNVVTKGEFREFLSHKPIIFRAPSAKEWQYAYSGGRLSENFEFSGSDNIDEIAWYHSNSDGHAHKPALKKPNSLDLYDMCGNYAEFCASYNDDQLLDLAEFAKRMKSSDLKSYKAEYFNMMWAAEKGIYGGCWDSRSTDCKKEAYVSSTNSSTNKFDSQRYTYRLVYSRPD